MLNQHNRFFHRSLLYVSNRNCIYGNSRETDPIFTQYFLLDSCYLDVVTNLHLSVTIEFIKEFHSIWNKEPYMLMFYFAFFFISCFIDFRCLFWYADDLEDLIFIIFREKKKTKLSLWQRNSVSFFCGQNAEE